MMSTFYRLVTLLEILEASASEFWRLAGHLGQLIARLDQPFDPNKMVEHVAELGSLQREAEKLKLRSTVQQLKRIHDSFSDDAKPTWSALRSMVIDAYQRMFDELQDRHFLVLPPESVGFYRQTSPLFGPEVEGKLPQMSEDIAEAGKCLALNRATAAVFHLMRVTEIAVQLFGNKLEIQLVAEKNWQSILDEVNKAIKALPAKDALTVAYAQVASHLYNVKVAWRNPVMHPKQTYTQEQAEQVYSSVKTFVVDLAGLL